MNLSDIPTAGNRTTVCLFDGWGNKISESITADGQTMTTTYTYDYRNRLISTTNPLGNISTITYDALGNKIAECGFDGTETTYDYDLRGRLLSQSTPINTLSVAQKQYAYDNIGRVIQEKQSTQPDSSTAVTWRTTAYAYDSMDRVTDIYVPAKQAGAEHTHYVYDAAGNLTHIYTGILTSAASPVYTDYALVKHNYDSYGRKISTVDALGQTESYTYGINDKCISETTNDGKVIMYTYDEQGNEIARKVSLGDTVLSTQSTQYDGLGRLISQSEGGDTKSYVYVKNQLTTVTEAVNGNTTSAIAYTYNARGLRTGYTLTVGEWSRTARPIPTIRCAG